MVLRLFDFGNADHWLLERNEKKVTLHTGRKSQKTSAKQKRKTGKKERVKEVEKEEGKNSERVASKEVREWKES